MSGADPQPVRLGRIVGLFGVRGWVKVFSFTEPREAILDYSVWLLGGDDEDWADVALDEGKRHGKSVLAKLAHVDDRDAAVALLGKEVAVARDVLPVLEAGQFYWTDLVGLEVLHKGERSLGRIQQMLETGAHDVMLVSGDTERLIPFVMGQVVLDVDIDAGKVSVDWEWD